MTTLSDRIRKMDVRDPETLDIFELRPQIETAFEQLEARLEQLGLPEVDLDSLDVLHLRERIAALEIPAVEMPAVDTEMIDRFDVLGVRKAVVDADFPTFAFTTDRDAAMTQVKDLRTSLESLVKQLVENANGLTPVARRDLADLEARVAKAERAAKAAARKAPAKKTTRKAPAKKAG